VFEANKINNSSHNNHHPGISVGSIHWATKHEAHCQPAATIVNTLF